MCIGPSNDGGFYLLALQKSDFEKIDFNKIDWQTSRVFRQLTDQLDEKCITFDKLQSLTDIDDAASLQKVLQNYHKTISSKRLYQLDYKAISQSLKINKLSRTSIHRSFF